MSQGGAQGLGLGGLGFEVQEGLSGKGEVLISILPPSLSMSLSHIPKIGPIMPFFQIYPRFHNSPPLPPKQANTRVYIFAAAAPPIDASNQHLACCIDATP